jgi:hypothetical protein
MSLYIYCTRNPIRNGNAFSVRQFSGVTPPEPPRAANTSEYPEERYKGTAADIKSPSGAHWRYKSLHQYRKTVPGRAGGVADR